MTTHLELGGEGAREFDAIRSLVARWGTRASGIGDDAAVIAAPRGDTIVVSVDASVEGRHFRRDWFSAREIAYRAVAAALSDLAAMAARPLGVLVALGVPRSWRDALDDLADGVGDAVDVVQTKILGGNLSDAGELSITTTVLGSAYAPLARSGARPGNVVYLTGRLGASHLALEELKAGRAPADWARAHLSRPAPRIEEARWLADQGATACIDVSDGLAADLSHVAAASGVAIEIDVDQLPCVVGIAPQAALQSGEEYELVVTMPAVVDAAAFTARFGLPLTAIGRVAAGDAGVVLQNRAGRVAKPAGHDHFS